MDEEVERTKKINIHIITVKLKRSAQSFKSHPYIVVKREERDCASR